MVNSWHLVKREKEWWVQSCTLPVDGSAEPCELLSKGLSDVLQERKQAAVNRGW